MFSSSCVILSLFVVGTPSFPIPSCSSHIYMVRRFISVLSKKAFLVSALSKYSFLNATFSSLVYVFLSIFVSFSIFSFFTKVSTYLVHYSMRDDLHNFSATKDTEREITSLL